VIPIVFKREILVALGSYRLKSGIEGRRHLPHLRNWELFGLCGSEWVSLDRVCDSKMHSNGQ
jgi:hypothetical protein